MTDNISDTSKDHVRSVNPDGKSSVVLVCEHASYAIPAEFDDLGIALELRKSHAAWDPGAMSVAKRLSAKLDGALIASGVSRLVYDCNRPPSAPDAMPERSEIVDIPGNTGLSEPERRRRTEAYYVPFRAALQARIARTDNPVIVTIHSFVPVFHGLKRVTEIGVLHDSDARLADAMLETAPRHTASVVERNQPYGPEHGVTHTLREHAISGGHLNVMLEIRNDLIETAAQQSEMADMIAGWVADAFARTNAKGNVKCVA